MKSDYHLFRFGIKPEWEDPQTRNGGKWVWEMKSAPAEQIDTAWLHTLLFLIGEQFSDESEVLGAVISLRKGNRSRLALWTRSASAREVLTRVGNEWRKQLPVSNAVKIAFYSHAQSIKSSSRELTPIYTV
jgi:translation initiation factor 4E